MKRSYKEKICKNKIANVGSSWFRRGVVHYAPTAANNAPRLRVLRFDVTALISTVAKNMNYKEHKDQEEKIAKPFNYSLRSLCPLW